MRLVKLEFPARLRSATGTVDLSSDGVRAEIAREMDVLGPELADQIRKRACAYFPPTYTVFVRTQFDPEHVTTVTSIWIEDPTIRWPQGLLTRKAWRVLVPVLAHMVADAYRVRLEGVIADIDERRTALTVLAPTRGWRDPVVLAAIIFVATSAMWLAALPVLRALGLQ
jgi:hypothetical protein